MSIKDCIIIFLILVILGLSIYIVDNRNQVEDIKDFVEEGRKRQAKFVLLKNRGALAIFESAPTKSASNEKKKPKVFVLSSKSAEIRDYCEVYETDTEHKGSSKQSFQKNPKCVLDVDHTTQEFKEAVALTKKPIDVIVNKGSSEEATVTMHRVLIASSVGSYCTTTFVGGDQYRECITQQEECDEYRKYDFPSPFWPLNEFLGFFPECKGLITK